MVDDDQTHNRGDADIDKIAQREMEPPLLLRDVNSYTLAVGMQQYLNPQNYLWGDFAAAAVLSAIPITVVFLLAQRWLVNGLTAGGVKG